MHIEQSHTNTRSRYFGFFFPFWVASHISDMEDIRVLDDDVVHVNRVEPIEVSGKRNEIN